MTEEHLVPDGWSRVNLGSVTVEEAQRVAAMTPPIVLSSTKHRGLVPSDEFFKGRKIYSADLTNYKVVRRNSFAYATNHLAEGSIGLQDQYPVACVSPIYTVFACHESAKPEFLLRVLKSPRCIAAYTRQEQASVDRRGAVRYRDFAQIVVDLPPLVEQESISKVCDVVDDAIRSTERLRDKLERMSEGLLRDLLTRGIGARGRLRDANGHPEEFTDTRLGALPKSWTVARLGDFCEIRSGSTPSRQSGDDFYSQDGVPWVKTLDLNDDMLDHTDEQLTELAIKNASCPRLAAGTVLVAMYGGWAQIGRTALLQIDATTNQAICGLSIQDETYPPFLLRALQQGRRRWRAVAASTRKDPNITKQDVANFLVPLPPAHEQIAIVESFEDHLALIKEETRRLDKLQLLREGVRDDLLSGRVRANGAEKGAA